MQTKNEVSKWCVERQIELSIEKWRGGTNHVHANIDAPHKIFSNHGTHNLGLWDGVEKPNWREIGEELLASGFADCTDPQCEYCNEE